MAARCGNYISGQIQRERGRVWVDMTTACIYDVKGGTLAQYDEIIAALGPQVESPDGLVHVAMATGDGFRVFDVWTSAAAYEGFAPVLKPIIEAAGLGGSEVAEVGRVERLYVTESAGEVPAVGVYYRFAGMTAERYREVVSLVDFGAVPASTRRAHIACAVDGGMAVMALWASEAAFRAFEPALQAAFAVAGVAAPAPEVGPVHRVGINPAAVQTGRA